MDAKILLLFCILAIVEIAASYNVGSSYTFVNVEDKGVVTVHTDGSVTLEADVGSPEQIWTLVDHPDPIYDNALEIKQEVVPSNEFSGFNGPRQWNLKARKVVEGVQTYTLLVGNRWCVYSQGVGLPLSRDECDRDDELGLYHLWALVEA